MTLWVLLYAVLAIAGWQLNKRIFSGTLAYIAIIVLFFGSIAVAGAYVEESELVVRIVFGVTFFAFGYIMHGVRGVKGIW